MGKEQCTSYCIVRSGREGYWRMLKKKMIFFFWTIVPGLNTNILSVVKFWEVVPVFAHGYSSGLGYCIKRVAERKAAG